MRGKVAVALVVLLLGAARAEAASIALRLGRYSPAAQSDLWLENVDTFDLALSDFRSVFGGAEFAAEMSEFVDLAFGIDGYSREVSTNYRDFVRDDGTEIRQQMRLTVVPITAGLRFLPLGKFHAVLPYVAGGFGLYPYEYREEGEFIDFSNFDIFGAEFRDRGVGVGGFAAAGLELSVSRGLFVFGEYRQHWVTAQHGEDFIDFGDFDLDSRQLGFGVTFRF